MALTPCAPCECISANIPNDKFKQDVIVLLCAILDVRSELFAALKENATITKAALLEAEKKG